jgi:hypothetical protein
MKPQHNLQGNCWHTPYSCAKCGGELCDVCHKHDEPRGECTECPPCKGCEYEDAECEAAAVSR